MTVATRAANSVGMAVQVKQPTPCLEKKSILDYVTVLVWVVSVVSSVLFQAFRVVLLLLLFFFLAENTDGH